MRLAFLVLIAIATWFVAIAPLLDDRLGSVACVQRPATPAALSELPGGRRAWKDGRTTTTRSMEDAADLIEEILAVEEEHADDPLDLLQKMRD